MEDDFRHTTSLGVLIFSFFNKFIFQIVFILLLS